MYIIMVMGFSVIIHRAAILSSGLFRGGIYYLSWECARSHDIHSISVYGVIIGMCYIIGLISWRNVLL